MKADARIMARDAILQAAALPRYRGNVDAAARDLATGPHWAPRKATLHAGLVLARAAVEAHGSARGARRAISGEHDAGVRKLLGH